PTGGPGGSIPGLSRLGKPLKQDGHTIPAPHMRNDPAPQPLPPPGADDVPVSRRRHGEAAAVTTAAEPLAWPVVRPLSARKPARLSGPRLSAHDGAGARTPPRTRRSSRAPRLRPAPPPPGRAGWYELGGL